jgi:hypothetical protein
MFNLNVQRLQKRQHRAAKQVVQELSKGKLFHLFEKPDLLSAA